MKYRPILFSAPMVRAILEGRKTQTRRVVTIPRELHCGEPLAHKDVEVRFFEEGHSGPGSYMFLNDCPQEGVAFLNCPYGAPGDRLWVRETWTKDIQGCAVQNGISYRADHLCMTGDGPATIKWRPSIFMPRWASRITLEVVSVRVERLQDISAQDAVAEGVEKETVYKAFRLYKEHIDPIKAYSVLWDAINGARPGFAWADNPWVWAIKFKRVEEVQS